MGILDNLTKNPSFLLLAGVGVALFVFRDKISDFFSTITGGIEAAATAGEISQGLLTNLQGNLTGTTNLLNQLTSDFGQFQQDVGTNFASIGDLFGNLFNQPPPETFTPPVRTDEVIVDPNDISNCECGGVIESQHGITFAVCNECQAQTQPIQDILPNQPASISDFVNRFVLPIPIQENFNVQSDIEGNVFRGGGQSFIGGSVTEIPVDRLSLGGIIDRFNVTASQAADIRARARDDFGGFDFGTNTGSGIGSLFPRDLNVGNVSDDSFQGLTAQEIAQRLTGGVISNF